MRLFYNMRTRSAIKELNKVLYDTIIEYDKSCLKNPVKREDFLVDDNGVLMTLKILSTNGLHISETFFRSNRPLTVEWMTEKPHIRFFLFFSGQSHVYDGAGNENYTNSVGTVQRNFLDTAGGGGTAIIHENVGARFVNIKMTLDFYINLLKDDDWLNQDSFHQYVLSGKPQNRPNEILFMDLKILSITQEILNSDGMDDEYRYHFICLKIREFIFSLHLNAHSRMQSKKVYSPSDNIENVRSYLILNLNNPPNSAELARIFRINEKKLKEDFKRQYGMTIYAYVVQVRMEKAKKLLLEDHNVNEVATLLRYQSVSHFIKVFKSKHGYTPKEFVKHFGCDQLI